MQALLEFLNSNFGTLIGGAVVSGLIVQYITSSWQQRNWVFQQRYLAAKALFDKELDQKWKLLQDINGAVAAVLAHSRFVVAAYQKAVPAAQLDQQISDYNVALLKWEADVVLYSTLLGALFQQEETMKTWESLKARRERLDVAIYEVTSGAQQSADGAHKMLHQTSDVAVALCRHMIAEIQAMQLRAHADEDGHASSVTGGKRRTKRDERG